MKILGTGLALGETALSNAALEAVLPGDLVATRTGIVSRRRSERSTWQLATLALEEALGEADLRPQDLEGILLSTNSGDQWVPPTATAVARALDCYCPAMDLNAACAGGLYALRLTAGFRGPVAVIASETVSRFCSNEPGDWCSVIFGDGAAAVIVEAPVHWLGVAWGTAPEGWDWMTVLPPEQLGRMDGRKLFDRAVPLCAAALAGVCKQAGIAPADLDLLVPHQANLRLIEAVARASGVSMDRVVTMVQHTGNLSSAALLTALVTAVRSDRVPPSGATVGFVAFGAGLTWAAAVAQVSTTEAEGPR